MILCRRLLNLVGKTLDAESPCGTGPHLHVNHEVGREVHLQAGGSC